MALLFFTDLYPYDIIYTLQTLWIFFGFRIRVYHKAFSFEGDTGGTGTEKSVSVSIGVKYVHVSVYFSFFLNQKTNIYCNKKDSPKAVSGKGERRLNWETVGLTMTMTKSSQHHAFVKYTLKPSANHLINISKKNITVNILSI